MGKLKNLPFAFAGIWAIGASLYLLIQPITITEVIAGSVSRAPATMEQVERQASWYAVQGFWGVVVLALFAFMYSSTWLLANRARFGLLGLISLIAVAATFLAGFSIGPLYLISVVAIGMGWLLIGLDRLLIERNASSG